jgi:hypothetical protein
MDHQDGDQLKMVQGLLPNDQNEQFSASKATGTVGTVQEHRRRLLT